MSPPDVEKLHQPYAGELFPYLWRLFDGRPEAEHCLMNTILRAWLDRIATNATHSHLCPRTRGRSLAAVRSATRALPHKQQAALLLRQYRRPVGADFAHGLRCSRSPARANLCQALSRLRRQFASREATDRRRS